MGFLSRGGGVSASVSVFVCERGGCEGGRVVSEDSRCLSEKSELVSPKRQMSNVLGPCGLWTEHGSQAAGVFTGIKEETLYSETN